MLQKIYYCSSSSKFRCRLLLFTILPEHRASGSCFNCDIFGPVKMYATPTQKGGIKSGKRPATDGLITSDVSKKQRGRPRVLDPDETTTADVIRKICNLTSTSLNHLVAEKNSDKVGSESIPGT